MYYVCMYIYKYILMGNVYNYNKYNIDFYLNVLIIIQNKHKQLDRYQMYCLQRKND